MTSALEALERLKEGNRRYVSNVKSLDALASHGRRADFVAEQKPIAVVLGCSDSRVPAEMVFDQGLGELFVIRVAGNIVAPSQVGSVEFAAARFGTPLVVVLGHSHCGAIGATIDQLTGRGSSPSRNIRSIVNRISPSIAGLVETDLRDDPEALMEEAVRANVRASANHLRHGSELLEQLIGEGTLMVVGAEYCLDSGRVDFFDLQESA
ncbi:carbonic anhydrase [Thiohalomonas denitrificans]|uniref:carbonic anhydrase n=1 Tax=Thiohalomonas denitrificans TaxID=415747 RepID=UPI0026EF5F05|nr:carbonic anhydrase [Thiohalomonas denitrificans]